MMYDTAQARPDRIQAFAFVIGVVICVLLSMIFITLSLVPFSSAHVGCQIELDDKINPNDAPVASLIRLPNIGLVRAEAIVAYRENFHEKNSESQPFQNCDDLQKVKGIGPKTVQNISEWLKFDNN